MDKKFHQLFEKTETFAFLIILFLQCNNDSFLKFILFFEIISKSKRDGKQTLIFANEGSLRLLIHICSYFSMDSVLKKLAHNEFFFYLNYKYNLKYLKTTEKSN